ncbi:MAG: hypothetical protein ACK5NT_01670 [Pyrinomonadaceae bacterium]
MLTRDTSIYRTHWQLGVLAGAILVVFSLYPQFKLWNARGEAWNGNYAYNDIDEVAYAAYLQALIDGRPRKNDPYTGNDQAKNAPQPESLFSIQFASPYLVAIPARFFGISAPWAMILAGAFAAFFAAVVLYFLILAVTGKPYFSLAGALTVLCGGALAAGEGAIGEILGIGFSYPYFPFLRRYVPAVPFPVFFLFCVSIYFLIRAKSRRTTILSGAIGFFAFTFLVFSYFYLWTTAIAFFACIFMASLLMASENRKIYVVRLVAFGFALAIPLIFYSLLLSNRVETMDSVQLLVRTHSPDFRRVPEYFSLVATLIIAGYTYLNRNCRSAQMIFSIAFALTPFVLFNQQVLTGRSLQPIHYQVFIGNYVAALSLVLAFGFLISEIRETAAIKLALILVALLATAWGFVECHYTVRVLDEANIIRDRNDMPVSVVLKRDLKNNLNPNKDTIMAVSAIVSDDLPTLSPQAVLWARHQHVFAGLSWQANKERYYRFLYFQNISAEVLKQRLANRDFVAIITLFGWGRNSTRLSVDAKPLTSMEIETEARNYAQFAQNFSAKEAYAPQLSHLVIPKNSKFDYEKIDKWYRRSRGEIIGDSVVYNLEPSQISLQKEKAPN